MPRSLERRKFLTQSLGWSAHRASRAAGNIVFVELNQTKQSTVFSVPRRVIRFFYLARMPDTDDLLTIILNDQHRTPVIACGEQPQQRFETFGAGALSDTELIAIMLHTGIRVHSVLGLASQLIVQAGSIAGLATWQPEDFQRRKGIGRVKGRQLAALIEISRRMIRQSSTGAPARWRGVSPPSDQVGGLGARLGRTSMRAPGE